MNKTNKTTSGHLKNIDRKQNSDQIKGSAKSNTHNNIICRKENFNQTLEASSILGENDKISLRGHSDHDIKTSTFYKSKENNQGTGKRVVARESAIQHKDKEFMQNGDEMMYIHDSSDVNLIEQQDGKNIKANQGSAYYCNAANIAVIDESTRL